MLALFVRFSDSGAARPHRELVASPADLRLVARQHRVFYVLLLAAPVEWLLVGPTPGWRVLLGGSLLGAGVWGYRTMARTLGPHLGPLIAPTEPAGLVEHGWYRHVRHPMYLGEIAMAVGTAVMLGRRLSGVLAVVFTALAVHRIGKEEEALRERLPAYADYARRTARLIPHVY